MTALSVNRSTQMGVTSNTQVFFISWWPNPYAVATDAFLQDLSQIKGYANPPWSLIGRVYKWTRLALLIWWHQSWRHTHGTYTIANCNTTSYQDNAEQRSGGSRPSASPVAYLRERQWHQELSEEAISLILRSWRTKINRSYDSLFSKWHCWCCSRGSDPLSGPIKEVVNFLAHLHKEGYRYQSLNSYRSAISSVHERIDGSAVGQHPLVTRLMKW